MAETTTTSRHRHQKPRPWRRPRPEQYDQRPGVTDGTLTQQLGTTLANARDSPSANHPARPADSTRHWRPTPAHPPARPPARPERGNEGDPRLARPRILRKTPRGWRTDSGGEAECDSPATP